MKGFWNKKTFLLLLTLAIFASLAAVPPASAEDAPDVTVTASYTYHGDSLAHVIDGIISYDDTPKSRWTAYESPNAQDWIRTTYATARTKDAVGIYLFSDGGGIKTPAGIQVQYWNGAAWADVAVRSSAPSAPTGNELNLIMFDPVSSSDFRVTFTHGAAKSGVTELRYWDSQSEQLPTSEVIPLGIVSASYTFRLDHASHLNDGIISYTTDVQNRWTAYESPNATDWIQTNFGGAVTKDAVGIYLYSDGGGVRPPAAYDVQYQDAGGNWTSAAGQVKSPQTPQGGTLNLVTFEPVNAQKFRIAFTHPDGAKSGATEITYVDSTRHTLPAEPSQGNVSASYSNDGDAVTNVNDGIVSFSDFPRNRWTAYGSPNASDWIETAYEAPRSMNAAGIYLYDDEGGVQAPDAFDVQYWNGSGFASVPNQLRTPQQPDGNALNLVLFDMVISDRFRVMFTHKANAKTGVTEIAYVDDNKQPLPEPADALEPDPYILVLSPSLGTSIDGEVEISFYAPDMKNVSASIWHQPDEEHPDPNGYSKTLPYVAPDEFGYGSLSFDADEFPYGPLTVVIHGWDSPAGDPNFTKSATTYVQLFNAGGVEWKVGLPAAPPQAAGMTVKFQDDFAGPLSVSKTGAGTTYTSLKPDWPHGSQFGEAIFADPTDAVNPFAILGDDFLRIRATKAPAGYVDPAGWNRKYIGGLLSSVRLDGTGISATNGYFEARMLMPAGKGAWPAFWLMSQNSTGPNRLPSTAELDTIEGYGHNPGGGCQAKHWWGASPELHATNCGSSNYAYGDSASTWHIYGTKVTPDEVIYYVDNVEVWRHDTFEQANTPLYFMINLALGGGWPIDLAAYHNQIDLYVDYVRVYEPAEEEPEESSSPTPTLPPSATPAASATPTPTPSPTSGPGSIQPVTTKDASGVIRSTFDETTWNAALQEARETGLRKVVVHVPDGGTVQQTLPASALDAANGVAIEIRTTTGSITLPSGWLSDKLVGAGTIVVQMETIRSGFHIHILNDGEPVDLSSLLLPATITVPYKPTAGQLAGHEFLIVTGKSGSDGTPRILSSGKYDAKLGGMRFNARPEGEFSFSYNRPTFTDAPRSDEMRHAVEALASKGIIRGVSPERFHSKGAITRADYVTLLMRMFEFEGGKKGASAFSDVDAAAYYGEHVSRARELGIVQGSGDNRFLPGNPISREEMALLTYRALKAAGLIDASDSPVEALQQAAILKGTGDGLELDRGASRAEAATVLYRIYRNL